MANRDNAAGFRLYNQLKEPRTKLCTVKASTIIYPGQPLKIATGYVEPAGATDRVFGIADGYMSSDANRKDANNTGQPAKVLVITDPSEHLFRTQTDGAIALTDIGKFGIHTATAADTVTKQARNFITYSTLAAAPGDISDGSVWEIVDIVPEDGNVAGAYADIIVRLHETPPAA